MGLFDARCRQDTRTVEQTDRQTDRWMNGDGSLAWDRRLIRERVRVPIWFMFHVRDQVYQIFPPACLRACPHAHIMTWTKSELRCWPLGAPGVSTLEEDSLGRSFMGTGCAEDIRHSSA